MDNLSYITCRDLSVAYDNKLVLENINFEINDGDYIAIVGENGSGKSTLVKTLVGNLSFKSGHLHYLNIKKNQIGYLPQQTRETKDFPATVFEVVLSGFLSKKGLIPWYGKRIKKLAEKNLEIIGMKEFSAFPFSSLSGGQKQRVLLARALSAGEKLLILDEPVTGLDPIVTNEFYKLIKTLNSELKISIIMVSHDVESAVKYANKILHLNHRTEFFGTTSDYLNTPLAKRFLGGGIND